MQIREAGDIVAAQGVVGATGVSTKDGTISFALNGFFLMPQNNKLLEDCFHLGVKALFCSDEGKVLLLERQHHTKGIYWDLPGGRLQKGETVTETLRREIEEETGLQCLDDASPFDMILTNIRIPTSSGEVGLILSIYHYNISSSFIPQLSSEHTGFGWFSFLETSQLLKAQYPIAFIEKLTRMDSCLQ